MRVMKMAKSLSTELYPEKGGDAYAQVTDFVRARFLSVAQHTRVGTVRGQPISLVLGDESRWDQVVLLCDLAIEAAREDHSARVTVHSSIVDAVNATLASRHPKQFVGPIHNRIVGMGPASPHPNPGSGRPRISIIVRRIVAAPNNNAERPDIVLAPQRLDADGVARDRERISALPDRQ